MKVLGTMMAAMIVAAVGGLIVVLVGSIPEIQRYLKMRQM